MSSNDPSRSTPLVRFVVVALLYFAAAWLGVAFVVESENIAVFWPPAGLLLGYLLITERRHWSVSLVAAFTATVVANVLVRKPLGVSLGFGVVNALEPAVGAWLIGLVRPQRFRLRTPRDLFFLFGVPAVVCGVAALGGAAIVAVSSAVTFGSVWPVWWMSDALGVVLFAPLVVCWADGDWVDAPRRPARAIAEKSLVYTLLTAISWGIFAIPAGHKPLLLTLPYPVFPVLLWVAIRFNARGTAVGVVLVSLIAVWGSSNALGPVSAQPRTLGDQVFLVQGFCVVVSLSSFLLTIAINDGRRRQQEVQVLNNSLRWGLAERQAALDELRGSEQRYRLLVDGVRDYAIFLLDIDGRVESWNVGAERIKGYREDEILGQHFSCFYPPEEVQAGKPVAVLQTVVATGQFEEEGWRVRKDGTRFWAHVVISAIFDEDRQLRGFAKATRDLTARREAEKALLKSELRFRAIFDQTFQFVGLMSADGIVLEANRTALEATGITVDQVIGKPFWDTPYWSHDAVQQARLRAAVDRARAGEMVRFEAHHPAADGGRIWVDFSIKPYLSDGDVVYLIPEGRDITDRKRTEQALAANEALLHQFIKYAPAAIAMLDSEMRYIRTSDRWVTDYHLTGQTLRGRSHYEVFPDVPERWKEIHRRVLHGSVESCAEDPFPRADGGVEWLQWEARPWQEVGGGIGGLIFFTQVITDRKRAEESLRESEARFRAVFEASPSGLLVVCGDGRITLSNDLALQMFGWEKDELVGALVERLIPERYQARHPANRGGYFAAPQARAMGRRADLTGRRKDGSEFPVEIGLTPVDTEGERFVLASVVDITARKRTEEALRVSEERLRLALGNAQHGLWDWKITDGSVFLDETWAAVHGYRREELAGDYSVWESRVHPEDKPRVLAALNLHLASDEAHYDVDYRARRKDGSWAWVNTRGRVQGRDEAGRPLRMTGTIHDISERKQAEEALLRSVREKEVMLREIHHRVKNNLAVISSLFHLQMRTLQDEKIVQVLREAQDRVRSMALVHEHLYNSADLGAVAFNEYTRTLANEIFQTYHVPSTHVDFVAEVGPVHLTIEQAIPCGLILNELLSNCLKHAFSGREWGRVRLAMHARDQVCHLQLSDDGVGIPAGLDVKMGKSLGLRLVRILARQLDGQVEYRSVGAGTEVNLSFPIQTFQKS